MKFSPSILVYRAHFLRVNETFHILWGRFIVEASGRDVDFILSIWFYLLIWLNTENFQWRLVFINDRLVLDCEYTLVFGQLLSMVRTNRVISNHVINFTIVLDRRLLIDNFRIKTQKLLPFFGIECIKRSRRCSDCAFLIDVVLAQELSLVAWLFLHHSMLIKVWIINWLNGLG